MLQIPPFIRFENNQQSLFSLSLAMAPRRRKRPAKRPAVSQHGDQLSTKVQRLHKEAENIPNSLTQKPFLETGLGGLAPEIREQIFINLLGVPPPFGGRDFRAEQTSGTEEAPISLTTFVDVKKSHFAILQTCRQLYTEAFPKFYASKSYYLASAQDLVILSKYPRFESPFRLDTINSLCLKNFVVNRPRWDQQQIDSLIAEHPTLDREELQAERINRIEEQPFRMKCEKLRSLRKICLCMRVGEEWEYLKFLFNIDGLKRGVIEFVDDFHWIIRSQSLSANDWKLQYTPFTAGFYRRGKNFEWLNYHEVEIQGEVLNIDSRASDLVEGDERWVEVDIGARNYEERYPESAYLPPLTPDQVSEDEESIPVEEVTDLLIDDASIRSSEQVQGPGDWEADETSAGNESIQDSTVQQKWLDWEDNDGELDQELEQGSSYPQSLASVDENNAQANSDTNKESEALEESPSNNYIDVLTENIPTEASGEIQVPVIMDGCNGSTTFESQSLQEMDHLDLSSHDEDTFVRPTSGCSRDLTTVPEAMSPDNMEPQHEDRTHATTKVSSEIRGQNYRDAQTQTDPEKHSVYNPKFEVEPEKLGKALQGAKKLTALPPQQGILHGESAEIGQETLQAVLAKLRSAGLQKRSNCTLPVNSELSSATLDKSSVLHAKPLSLPASSIEAASYKCLRLAAFLLALYLFYRVLFAKAGHTPDQVVGLLLSIAALFVAAGVGSV